MLNADEEDKNNYFLKICGLTKMTFNLFTIIGLCSTILFLLILAPASLSSAYIPGFPSPHNFTGSIALDRTVYPIPFGTVGITKGSADFGPEPDRTSLVGVFPLHQDITSQGNQWGGLIHNNVLQYGNVIVHIRVNDRNFNNNVANIEKIAYGAMDKQHGPVTFQISRAGQSMLLGTAGGPEIKNGTIVNLNGTSLPVRNSTAWKPVRDLGPMSEISPDAGIFQADLPIKLTDGPQSLDCPHVDPWDNTISGGEGFGPEEGRMHTPHLMSSSGQTGNYCVMKGDVLTVTYSGFIGGKLFTTNDTATFDLRNGILQSDKSVYVIGSDMILTLVDPDLNLDSQVAETLPLDLIAWESQAFKGTIGPLGGQSLAFDAHPPMFVETGKDTGIFQSIIKIPKLLGNRLVQRGEQISLEYNDWGPSTSKLVGLNYSRNILNISTSPVDDYGIALKTGVFIPPEKFETQEIKQGHDPDEVVHFLLQFSTLPDLSLVNTIASNGIYLNDYITGNTYIASSKVSNVDYVKTVQSARWAGPFNSTYKISKSLDQVQSGKIPWWAVDKKNRVFLTIFLNKNSSLGSVENEIRQISGENDTIVPQIPAITASFNLANATDSIKLIAQKEFTKFIDFVGPPLAPENARARDVSGVDGVQALDLGLDGRGVKVMVYDEAHVDNNIQFFPDIFEDGTVFDPPFSHHATSVAGTLAGSGVGSTSSGNTYKGMAPGAKILSFGFGYVNNPSDIIELPPSCETIPHPGCAQNNNGAEMYGNFSMGIDNGANLASMSLGANALANFHPELLGGYDMASLIIDMISIGTHSKELPIFEAVGNNRLHLRDIGYHGNPHIDPNFNMTDPPSSAKNSIVVGGINTDGEPITDYSGFGPTQDGRIKPDIVAPGSHDDSHGLISADKRGFGNGLGDSQPYVQTIPGTSFSTPVAAGIGTLIVQKWDGTHPSAIPGTPIPIYPSTIKAILIQTATDIGNSGPDYYYGWGEINAKAAIDLVALDDPAAPPDHRLIHSDGGNDVVYEGDTKTYPFQSTGDGDIKATLVWDDKDVGTLDQLTDLENDLDLSLIDPLGNIYHPFILSPSNPGKPATLGADHTNNVEMVIGNISPGSWTASVTGTSVPIAPQQYTLVISEVPHAFRIPITANSTWGGSPLTVNFEADPVGGTSPYSYTWDFGDGTPSTTGNSIIKHTFSTSDTLQTFVVKVTATDASSLTSSSSIPITAFLPTFQHSPSCIVKSSPTVLSITDTHLHSPPLSYIWDFGDGGTATSTVPHVTHQWNSEGVYLVRFTVTDGTPSSDTYDIPVTVATTCTAPSSSSSSILVASPPSASPTTGPAPLTVTFTEVASGGSNTYNNYAWNFGDGSAVVNTSAPTVSHPYSSAGVFPVTVTVTDSSSNTATSLGTDVTVISPPLSTIQLTINKNVDNGHSGNSYTPASFNIRLTGGPTSVNIPITTSSVTLSLSPGNYNVIENDLGYTVTYDGVCNNPSHTITLNSGDPPQTCTINNSHCLIATAAFGSELAPQVQFLRDFRDNHLLKTSVGSEFITVFNQWYYSFSPNVADYERQNPLLRDLVKTSIYPLLGILTVSEKGFTLFNGNFGTMAAGLMAVSMMGAVYISPLTLSIKGIRNGNLNLKITAIIVLGALVSVLIALASSNPTTIELTSLIFLLSIMALTSLATAKTFVRIVKKILKIKIKNF